VEIPPEISRVRIKNNIDKTIKKFNIDKYRYMDKMKGKIFKTDSVNHERIRIYCQEINRTFSFVPEDIIFLKEQEISKPDPVVFNIKNIMS